MSAPLLGDESRLVYLRFDRHAANEILNLLGKLNTEFNKTIVMVTHDPSAAERASICHRLDKGTLAR